MFRELGVPLIPVIVPQEEAALISPQEALARLETERQRLHGEMLVRVESILNKFYRQPAMFTKTTTLMGLLPRHKETRDSQPVSWDALTNINLLNASELEKLIDERESCESCDSVATFFDYWGEPARLIQTFFITYGMGFYLLLVPQSFVAAAMLPIGIYVLERTHYWLKSCLHRSDLGDDYKAYQLLLRELHKVQSFINEFEDVNPKLAALHPKYAQQLIPATNPRMAHLIDQMKDVVARTYFLEALVDPVEREIAAVLYFHPEIKWPKKTSVLGKAKLEIDVRVNEHDGGTDSAEMRWKYPHAIISSISNADFKLWRDEFNRCDSINWPVVCAPVDKRVLLAGGILSCLCVPLIPISPMLGVSKVVLTTTAGATAAHLMQKGLNLCALTKVKARLVDLLGLHATINQEITKNYRRNRAQIVELDQKYFEQPTMRR